MMAGASILSTAGLAFALSGACFPLLADVLPAVPGSRVALELGAEHFRWQEFGDDGRRLLTEQGLRYGAAVSLHNLARREEGMLFALTLRGTAGTVDYDGQDNGGRFVASETAYGGYRLEAMGGYRFEPAAVRFLDVIGAVGWDHWERDIRSSRNAVGVAVSGLVEDYRVAYARLGIGIAHEGGPTPPGHFDAGVRLPLSIHERVTFAGTPVRLEPGRSAALSLAYRVSLRPDGSGAPFGTYLRFSYEAYRFRRSPSRAVGDLVVWQPRSDMDIFGVTLGFSF